MKRLVVLVGLGLGLAVAAIASCADAPRAERPHYVLPAPWELVAASDLSLWTDDEVDEYESRNWDGYLEGFIKAWMGPFIPQDSTTWYFYDVERSPVEPWAADVVVTVHPRERRFEHTPDEPVEAFGLVGSFNDQDGRATPQLYLESEEYLMRVVSTTLDHDGVLNFLNHATLAGETPLEGLLVDESAFAQMRLPDTTGQPASWYGGWLHPDRGTGSQAMLLVRDMPVDLFRAWTSVSRWGAIPDDMSSQVDQGAVVSLGPSITYDAGQQVLIEHSEVDFDDLVPISRAAWSDRAVPVNEQPAEAAFYPWWFFPYESAN